MTRRVGKNRAAEMPVFLTGFPRGRFLRICVPGFNTMAAEGFQLGRNMWKQVLVAVLAGLAATVTVAQDEVYRGGLPPGDRPLEVLMGFNLVNITDVGEKEETLDFDGAIYLEWNDPRLAYAPEAYGMPEDWSPGDYSTVPTRVYQGDFAVKELFEGWRPHVVIPNGIGNRNATNMAISVWPDGHVRYSESFYAKVETPMDLRRFPFDTQQLEVFFHPFLYERHELVLVPDDRLARTWNQNLGIADWSRQGVTMLERATDIAYLDDARSAVSEFVVTVEVKRRPTHMIISIILPMILLVSLTWCVFWMDNETLANRVNITFIGILSVVAYYFVILNNVPEVSYLTFIDAFIISTFLILAAGVVVTVVVENYDREDKQEWSARVDRICRWAFPLAYFATSALLGIVFLSFY